MAFKPKDHFYKKAKAENYLARSIYKLEEIDKRFKILKKDFYVLDLGYYPGSWTQYSSKIVGKEGRVVGIDIQPINKKLMHLKNIEIYQGDIIDLNCLEFADKNYSFDVILSDMAPQTSGIKSVDQARSLELVEKTFALLPSLLKRGGDVVIKIFEGPDTPEFLRKNIQYFSVLHQFRPKSTRSASKEFFAIGKKFRY